MDIKFETGDLILTSRRGGSILSWFMNLFQTDPVVWEHVLVAKNNITAWEAHILIKEANIRRRLSRVKYYKVIRRKDLTDEQKESILEHAPTLLNLPYGVPRILLQMFDHFTNTNWFTKRFPVKYIQVCSSYAAWIYWKSTRFKFNNVEWCSCDPDDIEDEQLKHKDEWEIVDRRDSFELVDRRIKKLWRIMRKLMK